MQESPHRMKIWPVLSLCFAALCVASCASAAKQKSNSDVFSFERQIEMSMESEADSHQVVAGTDAATGATFRFAYCLWQTPTAARGLFLLLSNDGRIKDKIAWPGAFNVQPLWNASGKVSHLVIYVIEAYGTGEMKAKYFLLSIVNGKLRKTAEINADNWSDHELRSSKSDLLIGAFTIESLPSITVVRKNAVFSSIEDYKSSTPSYASTNSESWRYSNREHRFIAVP